MAAARSTTRRPYGAGSLYTRGEVWYAHWRADGGRQVKRRVGPMRVEGSREGLTRRQAEAELRRLIAETGPARMVTGDALTIGELGRRYLANLERHGRKKATTTAVESILRVWLEPFFADRDLRRIAAQDVQDLMTMMESNCSGRSSAGQGSGLVQGSLRAWRMQRMLRGSRAMRSWRRWS
ncbi:MAG: hypothetical protein ACRDK7_01990, partial [Solirubrobacteraceae bacterium]